MEHLYSYRTYLISEFTHFASSSESQHFGDARAALEQVLGLPGTLEGPIDNSDVHLRLQSATTPENPNLLTITLEASSHVCGKPLLMAQRRVLGSKVQQLREPQCISTSEACVELRCSYVGTTQMLVVSKVPTRSMHAAPK